MWSSNSYGKKLSHTHRLSGRETATVKGRRLGHRLSGRVTATAKGRRLGHRLSGRVTATAKAEGSVID